MTAAIPKATPTLNRLRAAAAMIPIIEAGLADASVSPERAAYIASFCEWAVTGQATSREEAILAENISEGLQNLKSFLTPEG